MIDINLLFYIFRTTIGFLMFSKCYLISFSIIYLVCLLPVGGLLTLFQLHLVFNLVDLLFNFDRLTLLALF